MLGVEVCSSRDPPPRSEAPAVALPLQDSEDAAATSQPMVGWAAVREVPEGDPWGDVAAQDIPSPPRRHLALNWAASLAAPYDTPSSAVI